MNEDPDGFSKTPDKFPTGFHGTPYTGYEGLVKSDDRRMEERIKTMNKSPRNETQYAPTYLLLGGLQEEVNTDNNVYGYCHKKRDGKWRFETMTQQRQETRCAGTAYFPYEKKTIRQFKFRCMPTTIQGTQLCWAIMHGEKEETIG